MDWIIVLLSILPATLWIGFFYHQNRYGEESPVMLLKLFVLGCFSVIPAVVFESFFQYNIDFYIPFSPHRLILIMLMVGFVEEFIKFTVLWMGSYNSSEFKEPMDGIVFSVTVAMGFAFIENIAYMVSFRMSQGVWGAYSIGILRGIFSMFGHASFAVILGLYFGRAKFHPEQKKNLLLKGIILASLVHAAFNFALVINRIDLAALPLLLSFFVLWRNLDRVYVDAAEEESPFKPDFVVQKFRKWKWSPANIGGFMTIVLIVLFSIALFYKPVPFKNENMGYQLSYPSYWTRRSNRDNSILELQGPSYRNLSPKMRIEVKKLREKADLDRALAMLITEFSRKTDNLKKMHSEDVSVNGNRGRLVQARWKKHSAEGNNETYISYIVLLERENEIIIFHTESVEDQFEDLREQFRNIIYSFRTIEKKTPETVSQPDAKTKQRNP
jgi:protease PrsW